MKEKAAIIIAGVVLGLAALLLAWYGNPANMGFCIACFLRDIAGGLGLHRAEAVQYLRPEIAGLVLALLPPWPPGNLKPWAAPARCCAFYWDC